MEKLKQWFNLEQQHYQRLSNQGQRLLSSILLYDLIGPLFSIFINAFLWRQSQDITVVAIYNLSLFVAIPSGFYLNGFLLRKFPSNMLYSFGLFWGGLTIATLIFLPEITLPVVIAFGLIDGVASGVYWANRNLLTLKTTQSENRMYFSSLESAFKALTNIVIPLLIGYFITFGNIINLYTPVQGYKMLAIIMLLVIGIIGWIMASLPIKQAVPHMFLQNPGKSWKRFRLYELLFGFLNGSSVFLPVLIVLSLVGEEETLGTIQSLTAILTAIIVYTLGKKLTIKHRIAVLTASVLLGIMGAVFLSISYAAIGVFVFFACKALSEPFIWIALNSLNYDLIDKENKNSENHYAYVCDQEIYLNAGRITGILFFLALVQFFSNDFGLRFAPLFFALSQIILLIIARSVETHHKKIAPEKST